MKFRIYRRVKGKGVPGKHHKANEPFDWGEEITTPVWVLRMKKKHHLGKPGYNDEIASQPGMRRYVSALGRDGAYVVTEISVSHQPRRKPGAYLP